MTDKIDSVEAQHLDEIRAWRGNSQTQLDFFRERVRTFEQEVHDSFVMERGHLAFLARKYGTPIQSDGTITQPEQVTTTDTPVEPTPTVETVTAGVSSVELEPLDAAPIDLTTEANTPVEAVPADIPNGVDGGSS